MTTHRKLLEDPYNSTETAGVCTFQCDPLKTPPTNCIPTCIFNTTVSPPPYTVLDSPPKPHHSSLSLPLKISLVILILTFSFFILYTFYKFYTVWYRSRRRHHPPPPSTSPENEQTHDQFLDHDVMDHPIWYIRTIGLQPSVISAITVVKYNKHDGLIDGVSCSVCLSDFQQDETLRLLPKCNHAFHVSCIDTWLGSHTSCPLCRAGIVKGGIDSGSSGSNSLDEVEEAVAVSVPNEGDGEERERELTIGGGSGMIRRSVSLNDYEACRVRSDICNNNNNNNRNNYYSDRHEVQIRSVDGGFGFDLVKVDRTANNQEQ